MTTCFAISGLQGFAMADITPEVRKIIDEQEASLQRISMSIIDLPREQREAAFGVAQKEFDQGIANKVDPKWGHACVDILVQRLRSRVSAGTR